MQALPVTLLSKRLCHNCFPVNFPKFLRTISFSRTPLLAVSILRKSASYFLPQVHDLQRLMEENEKQKEAAIYEKDKEINKMQEIVSSLESEIEQWKEKETKLKEKVQKVNETKQGTVYFYTDKVH